MPSSRDFRAWLEVNVPTRLVTPRDVAWFLNRARTGPASGLLEDLPESGPLHGRNLVRHLGSFGVPGTRWGSLSVVTTNKPGSGSLRAWSTESWDLMMKALDRDPVSVVAKVSSLTEFGDSGAGEAISFEVSRVSGTAFTQFAITRSSPSGSTAEFDTELTEWLELFCECLRRLPASQGFIADDNRGEQGCTPLELALRHARLEWAESGLLRQYAWTTFLPLEAVSLVGGIDTLRESGAFWKVVEVEAKGVLAVATQLSSEYDANAVGHVFRALAPALPAGTPRAPSAHTGPFKMVYEDAGAFGGRPLLD